MLKVNEINIEEFIEYKSKLSSSHLNRGHFFLHSHCLCVYAVHVCACTWSHVCGCTCISVPLHVEA